MDGSKAQHPVLANMGQSLVELLATVSLLMLTVVGSGSLFKAAWNRYACSRLAFEQAHRELLGERFSPRSNTLTLRTHASVVSFARCGKVREQVGFERLESIP